MLGRDYVDTFLTSHHPYDYAKEHIIYPRREYFREYRSEEITQRFFRRSFSTRPCKLRRCSHRLLEYHIRESSKNMINGFPQWHVEEYFNHGLKREEDRVYGPRWILVSYYRDAFVNFIQVGVPHVKWTHGLENHAAAS